MSTPFLPSRRTLLGAAGAGLLIATTACTGRSTDDGTEGSATAEQDQQVLDAVRTQVAATAALVTATTLTHPRLATTLSDLQGVHVDHLRVLGPADDNSSTPTPTPEPAVPARPRLALARVRTEEEALATFLAREANRASSGRFARLLASMSAALTQQVSRTETSA